MAVVLRSQALFGRAARALSSSASSAAMSSTSEAQGPTYTYASPGSSMTEPGYFNEPGSSSGSSGVGSMESPAGRVTPTKKAQMLKLVLGGGKRKLAAQGSGVQMLPPGCSISDPSYSIKDPVYFVDQ